MSHLLQTFDDVVREVKQLIIRVSNSDLRHANNDNEIAILQVRMKEVLAKLAELESRIYKLEVTRGTAPSKALPYNPALKMTDKMARPPR